MIRGGDKVTVAHVYITGKAWAQYCQYSPDEKRGLLAKALTGIEVTRQADTSPYYLATFGGMRYVFAVAYRCDVESGRFALVTVQEAHHKK